MAHWILSNEGNVAIIGEEIMRHVAQTYAAEGGRYGPQRLTPFLMIEPLKTTCPNVVSSGRWINRTSQDN